MTSYWLVLGLAALPALGNFAGGALAEFFRPEAAMRRIALTWSPAKATVRPSMRRTGAIRSTAVARAVSARGAVRSSVAARRRSSAARTSAWV